MTRILAVLLLLAWVTAARAEDAPVFAGEWGGIGPGPGQFDYAGAIALDSQGRVHVTDLNNGRVQVFSSTGSLLTQYGHRGVGDGEFNFPTGIAIDADDTAFVADFYNHRVQVFAPTGIYVRQWPIHAEAGVVPAPFRIAVGDDGFVYVTVQQQVHKYGRDGTFVKSWGGPGSGGGSFVGAAHDIDVAPSTDVLVVDHLYPRIEVFDSSGVFESAWGSNGTGDGQFSGPSGIAVDATGDVYVGDVRVQKFTSGGQFLWSVGGYGRQPAQFLDVYDVAIAGNGTLYVSDFSKCTVQRFVSSTTPVLRKSWAELKRLYR